MSQRWKEYRNGALKGDHILDGFTIEEMPEGTGYISIRELFESSGIDRRSRWVLHQWLDASEFHHGGDMLGIQERMLDVPIWAGRRGCRPWVCYLTQYGENDSHADYRAMYRCRFFFQSPADAEAFSTWLESGETYPDQRPKITPLRSRVEHP